MILREFGSYLEDFQLKLLTLLACIYQVLRYGFTVLNFHGSLLSDRHSNTIPVLGITKLLSLFDSFFLQ